MDRQRGHRRVPPLPIGYDRYSVNVCVSTVWPPCTTVMVALVKATSVICAVQLPFGQPACAAVGCAGAPVVTAKLRLPFLISVAGIDCVPVSVTVAGF